MLEKVECPALRAFHLRSRSLLQAMGHHYEIVWIWTRSGEVTLPRYLISRGAGRAGSTTKFSFADGADQCPNLKPREAAVNLQPLPPHCQAIFLRSRPSCSQASPPSPCSAPGPRSIPLTPIVRCWHRRQPAATSVTVGP